MQKSVKRLTVSEIWALFKRFEYREALPLQPGEFWSLLKRRWLWALPLAGLWAVSIVLWGAYFFFFLHVLRPEMLLTYFSKPQIVENEIQGFQPVFIIEGDTIPKQLQGQDVLILKMVNQEKNDA